MSGDLLGERPLLQYLRYKVQLESAWLKKNLDMTPSEADLARLGKMDRPENMAELADIGAAAAARQVAPDHFPVQFDLA
jgi:hypothetical protein